MWPPHPNPFQKARQAGGPVSGLRWSPPDSRNRSLHIGAHAARTKTLPHRATRNIIRWSHKEEIPALRAACDSNGVVKHPVLQETWGRNWAGAAKNMRTFPTWYSIKRGKKKARAHAHPRRSFSARGSTCSAFLDSLEGHGIADRSHAAGAAHSGGIDSRADARFESYQYGPGTKKSG